MVDKLVISKCLGITLNQTEDDWPVVRWNINQARKVWGRLGEFMRREGADPIVAKMFYRAVT